MRPRICPNRRRVKWPSELEHEGPGMSDEAAAGLEQPLLEARQGPAWDGEENMLAEEIAERVGDPLRSNRT
jgi:hypothetical protein